MKEIPVSGGYVALVDDEDYEMLSQHTWFHVTHRHGGRETTYAYTHAKPKGSGSNFSMHGMLVPNADHRNHNGLDNRRHNLRTASTSQNHMNMRKTVSATSSKFKGVSRRSDGKKWIAYIKINHKMKHLGSFVEEIAAAKAYDAAAKQMFGEFACLNFMEAL